jgi:energy-coupling factor transport system permease protein
MWLVLLAGILGLVFRHAGVLAGLLAAAHLALITARIPADRIKAFWSRLALLLVLILVLQPLFAPGAGPDLLRLGPVRLTSAGLLAGVSFALRAAALAFVVAVLLLTTEANDLVSGLVKLGIPYPWGLAVGLSIRYLPTTHRLFLTISEAQQARGWLVGEGHLLRRARSYLPILVATVIAALRLSDALGMALAARGLGYPAKRTTLRTLRLRLRDWLTLAFAATLFAAALLVRYGLGFGGDPW